MAEPIHPHDEGIGPVEGGLLGRIAKLRAPKSTTAKRSLLAVSAIAFVVMLWLSITHLPDDPKPDPNWWLLGAVTIIGPCCTIACNAYEYITQNRLIGRAVPFLDAVRISVIGTAANLMPVPGSALVRTQAMASGGAGYKKATAATALVGVAWIGATGAIAGPGAMVAGAPMFGGLVALAGFVLLALSFVLVRRMDPPDGVGSVFGAIVAVEAATTVVGGLRLYLVIIGLGLEVSGVQALALTLSGALANATGIFPAGLGIREAITAGIARLVDLPASVGFLAAAVDRIMGLIVVTLLSVLLALRRDDAPAGDPTQGETPSPAAQGPTL